MIIRAPAVPLINVNPFFNIWSNGDCLNACDTKHWAGQPHRITAEIEVDGESFRLMGITENPAMPQVSLDITATASRYTFENDLAQVELGFICPRLPDDLTLFSRPVVYIEVTTRLKTASRARLVFTADDSIVLSHQGENEAVYQKGENGQILWASLGNAEQNPLNSWSEWQSINWGYFYMSALSGAEFQKTVTKNRNGTMGSAIRLTAEVTGQPFVLALAYDTVYEVEYFGKPLKPYWTKECGQMTDLLQIAFHEFKSVKQHCNRFDQQLFAEAVAAGGEKYAELLNLSYRQIMGAHSICEDENGKLLFLSKECGSGAFAATVDVSYPSSPIFLRYRPELIEAMLRPILRYDASAEWPHDYAPHDIGFFPFANGQKYSNGIDSECQMPIEECGNMLIMTAATCIAGNTTVFAKEHWVQLQRWAGHLIQYGFDPGNQLCTDDFAGKLAHNCNLSIKAIMGIASYGVLCEHCGKPDGEKYLQKSREMAKEWVCAAANEDGTFRLAFDKPNTFSLKYNAIWDKVFKTNIFPKGCFDAELKSYITVRMNDYGTPLDNRDSYTKSDWIVWAAAMFEDKADFEKMIAPLWQAYNDTDCRIPMSDWYYSLTSRCREFNNRTVQGGLFMRLLTERGLSYSE